MRKRLQNIKKGLSDDSPTINRYDLIMPINEAAATFGFVLYLTWMSDGCPLNLNHDPKLNFVTLRTLEFSLAFATYLLSLACRLAKKKYQLTPNQEYIELLRKERNSESSYGSTENKLAGNDESQHILSVRRDLAGYSDSLKRHRFHKFVLFYNCFHRACIAAIRLAAVASVYALWTIQNSKKTDANAIYWHGCWEPDFFKIVSYTIAMLSGLIATVPLTNLEKTQGALIQELSEFKNTVGS